MSALRETEKKVAAVFGRSGDIAMIKNGGDITTLLLNNCHFNNLIEGADSHAHERVCQFLGNRIEQLGYVLVHKSDLAPHTDSEEEVAEKIIPTSSTLSILNISSPKEEG